MQMLMFGLEFPRISRALTILVTIVALAGCVNFRANYIDPMYGQAASDFDPESQQASRPEIPPGAPSISQGFNPAPAVREQKNYPQDHAGIDIVAPRGTPILASSQGTVVFSSFEPLFGHQVSIIHDLPGSGKPFKTNYLHLRERLVEQGDRVKAGEQIGSLGSSGVFAAFPHLHYEVRVGTADGQWIPLNPNHFWIGGRGLVTCFKSDLDWPDDRFAATYPVVCKPGSE